MLDLHIIERGHDVPVVALPGLLGKRRAARMVGDTIEELIAFMDRLGGDPDLEDGNDAEADQEDGDVAWAEWHTRRHHLSFAEPISRGAGEDDEDDDPAENDDPRDVSWPEGVNGLWQMAMNAAHDDDAEDDDAAEEDDPAGGVNSEDDFDLRDPEFGMRGPGCPISDPGGSERDGCEHDGY